MFALRWVQPHSVGDNSPFSPIRLTVPSDAPYDQEALSFSHFKQPGESDAPSWHLSSGTPHLGHCPACPTPLGPSGVVASVLSLCASSPSAARGARAATRARWQTGSATLLAPDSSHGSGENHPTMDSARSALLPLAKGVRLRGIAARCGCMVMRRGD